MERYEEIRTYDDFMAWLDEKPEHANSDLGLLLAHEPGRRARQLRPRLRQLRLVGLSAARGQITSPTIDGAQRRGDQERRHL